MCLHHAQNLFSACCNSTDEAGREGCPGLPSTVGKTELYPWCEFFALLDARWQNTHLRATDPFPSANWPFSTGLAHARSKSWRSAWSKWCKRRGCAVEITSKCKTDTGLIYTETDKTDSSLATVSGFLRGIEITQKLHPPAGKPHLQEKTGGEKSEYKV